MGGMNLQATDSQLLQPGHFCSSVENIFRMHGAEGKQTARIAGTIFCDPIINFRRISNHVRADVVDDSRALYFRLIQELEELFSALCIFQDVVVVPTAPANQFKRLRLDRVVGLYVNMNVYDWRHACFPRHCSAEFPLCSPAKFDRSRLDRIRAPHVRPRQSPDAESSLALLPSSE